MTEKLYRWVKCCERMPDKKVVARQYDEIEQEEELFYLKPVGSDFILDYGEFCLSFRADGNSIEWLEELPPQPGPSVIESTLNYRIVGSFLKLMEGLPAEYCDGRWHTAVLRVGFAAGEGIDGFNLGLVSRSLDMGRHYEDKENQPEPSGDEVERVARAMASYNKIQHWQSWIPEAKAAIAAMARPKDRGA